VGTIVHVGTGVGNGATVHVGTGVPVGGTAVANTHSLLGASVGVGRSCLVANSDEVAMAVGCSLGTAADHIIPTRTARPVTKMIARLAMRPELLSFRLCGAAILPFARSNSFKRLISFVGSMDLSFAVWPGKE
jgi:hypothetical protein